MTITMTSNIHSDSAANHSPDVMPIGVGGDVSSARSSATLVSVIVPRHNEINRLEEVLEVIGRQRLDGREVEFLIAESPALGLRFRFVSTGTGHVSTHNQYLEWLYKAGVVGTASIVTFWAAGVQMLFRHAGRQRMRVRSACFAACVGVVLAVVASAMFQSSLTYAPMANLCFLVCGLLATRFGYPNDAGHGCLASVATVREAA